VNLIEFVNQFPPALCLLMASRGSRPLSARDMEKRSGIPKSTINKLTLNGWGSADVGTIDTFMSACGVNLFDAKRLNEKRKRKTWQRLAIAPARDRIYFLKLVNRAKETGLASKAD